MGMKCPRKYCLTVKRLLLILQIKNITDQSNDLTEMEQLQVKRRTENYASEVYGKYSVRYIVQYVLNSNGMK